jgi:hypothetical protein
MNNNGQIDGSMLAFNHKYSNKGIYKIEKEKLKNYL